MNRLRKLLPLALMVAGAALAAYAADVLQLKRAAESIAGAFRGGDGSPEQATK